MIGSEKVREARKAGQLERLKVKENSNGNDYAEYFAGLPKQQLKAQVNEKIRSARQELRDAAEDLAVAEETGEGLLAAQEAAQVAALYVNKIEESKLLTPSAVLSVAGGATT